MWLRRGVVDGAVGEIDPAALDKALVQRVQQKERVGMAVIRGPRCADDGRTDTRQHVAQLAGAEHLVFKAEIAGLNAHLLHAGAALLELLVAQAKMHATRALMADIDAGAGLELGRELGPFLG
jgi:hypothetical protein